MIRFLTDTCAFAFVQGLIEHLKFSPDGRTHENNMDWNEAYDRGWNFADRITRRTPADY